MREEPKNLDPWIGKCHHAITTVLGVEAEIDGLDLHRHDTIVARNTGEEADGQNLQDIRRIMKTTKSSCGRRALLAELAEHQDPKDSNYPMISRSMMDRKNPSRGC
jgi:hypothetical protein